MVLSTGEFIEAVTSTDERIQAYFKLRQDASSFWIQACWDSEIQTHQKKRNGLAFKFNAFVKKEPRTFDNCKVSRLAGWEDNGPTDPGVKSLIRIKLNIKTVDKNKNLNNLRNERNRLMTQLRDVIQQELSLTTSNSNLKKK